MVGSIDNFFTASCPQVFTQVFRQTLHPPYHRHFGCGVVTDGWVWARWPSLSRFHQHYCGVPRPFDSAQGRLLRCLQGQRCCLCHVASHAQLRPRRHRLRCCNRLWFPPLRLRSGQALRKEREGRSTRRFFSCPRKVKSLSRPPGARKEISVQPTFTRMGPASAKR